VQGQHSKLNGYAAIIAVLKQEGVEPEKAVFKVVDEIECPGAERLIAKCFQLRGKWGFGLHPDLLAFWVADHRKFEMVTAKVNTRMVQKGRDEEAFIACPPDDFDMPNAFDLYMDQLKSVMSQDKRLFLGDSNIIKKRILAFNRDDPVITAIGGLVYTLMIRQPWLEQTTSSMFQMPEW
jgi:hypothetical protein